LENLFSDNKCAHIRDFPQLHSDKFKSCILSNEELDKIMNIWIERSKYFWTPGLNVAIDESIWALMRKDFGLHSA